MPHIFYKEMVIRKATCSDWIVISEIYNSVRLNQFPWIDPSTIRPDDLRRDSDGEEVHIAIRDGVIMGFISVWSPDNFIHHLYVSADFQGQGVGTRLLGYACDAYCGSLRLKCVQKNEKALGFYKKNGWFVVDYGVSEEGDYVLMEYPISAKHVIN